MTKEGMIELARARIEQKSQERHFSDESVLNMKRAYEVKCEWYESEIKELEAQIEKMRCCGNCAKRGHICVAEEMQGNLCGKNKDKWEIKEK